MGRACPNLLQNSRSIPGRLTSLAPAGSSPGCSRLPLSQAKAFGGAFRYEATELTPRRRALSRERSMPRFFFDIHDGEWSRDDVGTECRDVEAACQETKQSLPEIALDQVPRDGDHHMITVLVTDEDRQPVYTATLTFAGLRMKE